jgi:hypothetical protein
MSSIGNPQSKKAMSYARDHRVRGGENDKAFRRKWPIKKRKASRAWRHAADGQLRRALADAEPDVDPRLIQRRHLVKWGIVSLAKCVEYAEHNREGRAYRRSKRKTAPP